jgi:hypothetical protein
LGNTFALAAADYFANDAFRNNPNRANKTPARNAHTTRITSTILMKTRVHRGQPSLMAIDRFFPSAGTIPNTSPITVNLVSFALLLSARHCHTSNPAPDNLGFVASRGKMITVLRRLVYQPVCQPIDYELIDLKRKGYLSGHVLNAGAGWRDISHLVDGILVNQDLSWPGDERTNIDIVSPIDNIPRPDNTFDTIICIAVLEHVENPESVCGNFFVW